MNSEQGDGPGVGPEAIDNNMQQVTTTHPKSTTSTDHGAIVAADSANGLFRFLWEQAVVTEVTAGNDVSADTLQEKYGLPDIGPACGGVFMSLHKRGQIRRQGWRPSTRPSRAGSVVAVWGAGDTK